MASIEIDMGTNELEDAVEYRFEIPALDCQIVLETPSRPAAWQILKKKHSQRRLPAHPFLGIGSRHRGIRAIGPSLSHSAPNLL